MIQWILFRQNHVCHTITLCMFQTLEPQPLDSFSQECFSRSNLDSQYVSQIPRRSTASKCKSPRNSMYRTLLGSFCLLLSRHWCNAGFIFIIDFVNEAHPGIPWNTERHKATFMEWEIAVLWFRVSKHGRNIPNIHGDWNFVYQRMTTITTIG